MRKIRKSVRGQEVREGKRPELRKIKDYTLIELAQPYLQWAERQRSYKTKGYLIQGLLKEFGNIPLRGFTTLLVEQFQTRRLNAGNKPATANRLLSTLGHMFTKAVEWDMVEEEVLKRIRRARPLPENNRRLRFLSLEECGRLIDSSDDHLRPIVITALNTGMRKQEILSLRWENVDLKNGLIMLTQDQTKNAERKEIPINDTLRAALVGLERRLDLPWVFFDPISANRYKDVKGSFASACRRAGIKDFCSVQQRMSPFRGVNRLTRP